MKEELYKAGVELMETFCEVNNLLYPHVVRLRRTDRLYHLATCAYYRPYTINIMVEKCAVPGTAGRQWSWPGYVIDRTPYGVIQHELGHHVDTLKSGNVPKRTMNDYIFSRDIYQQSEEKPLTGYLGTDDRNITFYMEWFAENFRLFVTNPDLSKKLRPKFYAALVNKGIKPVETGTWREVLNKYSAPQRTVDMAEKKISEDGHCKTKHLQRPAETALLNL